MIAPWSWEDRIEDRLTLATCLVCGDTAGIYIRTADGLVCRVCAG